MGGGLNLYGFAGGDPANFSDPFGLCPPYDHDPCNMHSGDPNIDDPERRQVMEQTFKEAPPTTDANNAGLRDERGAWVSDLGGGSIGVRWSVSGTPQTANMGQRPSDAIFGVHSHPNEGKYFNGPTQASSGILSSFGPGTVDQGFAARQPVPTYVVGAQKIWRITPTGDGKHATVQSFNRWAEQ